MFPTSVTAWSKLVSFVAGHFTRMRTVSEVHLGYLSPFFLKDPWSAFGIFDFCVRRGGKGCQVVRVWREFVRLGEHMDFPLSIFKHPIIAAMIVVV